MRQYRSTMNLIRTLSLLALIWALASPVSAQDTPEWLPINYVSATSIYISGGRLQGLAVGDLLEVVKDGEVIAELEVAFVAERSASCKIREKAADLQPGDRARISKKAPRVAPPEPTKPVTVERAKVLETPAQKRETVPPPKWTTRSRKGRSGLNGSVSLRFQAFEDGSTAGRDFNESTARVNISARQLGGRPYDLRIRMRSRETFRTFNSERFRRDRLYEFALVHDPPEGRFSFVLGRIGATPFATLGYLDGIVGQYKVTPKLSLGGFYGTRPEIEELGFASSGQKYGGFLKWSTRGEESKFFSEILVAGIGQYEGGEVDREYLAIESRFGSTGRWRLYQRAEIDLNNDWRKTLGEEAYQVSNLSLSGSYRATEYFRVSLSYDQRRRFRTLDTREIPEDRFDDLLREGLRLGFSFGRPRGWNVATTFGLRDREGDAEPTWSFAGSVYRSNFLNRNMLVAMNVSAYSGALVDGFLLSLQVRKYIRGGHDLGVTLGTSTTTVHPMGSFTGSDREQQWIRIQASIRLPWRLFLVGEYEIISGDDLDGQRMILELGYRF